MKIKITCKILLIALFNVALFSCAATPKKTSDEITEDEFVFMTPEQMKEAARKQAEAELFELGWTKKSSKNVDATYGNVRLRARKSYGTFNISIVNENGKTIPALSTSNEYITSAFYLKAGKKVIKLNQNSSVKSYSRETENGMQVIYVIDGLANVVLDFSCFSSDPKNMDINSVKITAAVKNTGKKKGDFALKMVFDTVLGETDRHHFYSSDGLPVKSEKEYRNIKQDDWFVSQNANGSMMFTFAGLEATAPVLVAMANYSTFENGGWIPNMLDYRSFDTILSYNNSAVGAVWEDKKLSVDEIFSEVFYVTLSSVDEKITSNVLIKSTEKNEAKRNEAKKNDKNSVEPVQKQDENDSAANSKTDNTVLDESKKEELNNQDSTEETIKEEPVKQNLSNEKYSDEYIQMLLDKIEMLKEDGSVNQSEIDVLNAELDLIFESMVK